MEFLTRLKPDSNKLLLPLCWWSVPFRRNRELHVPIAINYWILEHFKIFFALAVMINIVKQPICLSAMNVTKWMCWLKCKHYLKPTNLCQWGRTDLVNMELTDYLNEWNILNGLFYSSSTSFDRKFEGMPWHYTDDQVVQTAWCLQRMGDQVVQTAWRLQWTDD